MMKKHNFSAGPCILPQSVFEKISESIVDYNNSGLSIVEISHRSTAFVEVIEKARKLALELAGLENKGYKALFLHGGASMQFLTVAYNLLQKKASYLDTGTWSLKAIKEASLFGNIDVIASSKDKNYTYIPKGYNIPTDSDYFHCTSNNTIYGTQIKEFPEAKVPMVCDMSSDIFSRNIDFSKFDVIYAGAQKNIGAAGVAMVIIKEDVLGKVQREIPSMHNYQLLIEKESMFNTPPVFSIYSSMLTLEWLQNIGGIDFIEKVNRKKASLLYQEIDRNPLFNGTAVKEDRSMMNATFTITNKKLQPKFYTLWKEANINGLEGHRSVKGYRASMYNAMPLYSVQVLVDVMQELERIS